MGRASEHTPPLPLRERDGERGNSSRTSYLPSPTPPQHVCGTTRSRARHLLIGLTGLVLGAAPGAAQALESDAEQPINIRARSVEANEKTGVSVYQGNVVLTQGSLRIEADRLEVTLRERQTELIRAWGKPVRASSRTDRGEDIRARAGRIEYDAKRRQLDLYGNIELRRDGDLLTGATVHYALDQDIFTAVGGDGGQVSAVIQPAKREAPR